MLNFSISHFFKCLISSNASYHSFDACPKCPTSMEKQKYICSRVCGFNVRHSEVDSQTFRQNLLGKSLFHRVPTLVLDTMDYQAQPKNKKWNWMNNLTTHVYLCIYNLSKTSFDRQCGVFLVWHFFPEAQARHPDEVWGIPGMFSSPPKSKKKHIRFIHAFLLCFSVLFAS